MLFAICDDCYEDRVEIRGLIEQYSKSRNAGIEVVEYSSGGEMCRSMEELKKYTMIFLNANMKREDGLKIAKKITNIYEDIPVVLVTEVLSYALEGYRVKATRFLLKKDLKATLPECLDEILDELKKKKQKMSFPFVEGEIVLEIQKIIYIETNRHKNVFHTTDDEYVLYKKLDEIEEELSPYDFVRAHKSFLVNMRYIEKISSYNMRLTTGNEISVPKSRYQNVKRKFAIYKGA